MCLRGPVKSMGPLFIFGKEKIMKTIISKINYDSISHRDEDGYPMYYETSNPLFKELPQYHFDRAAMSSVFDAIFEAWLWDHIEDDNNDEFLITRRGDEFYIIHFPSGTVINWYKHVGRTNTCNKDLTVDDLIEFKKMLLESFGYEESKVLDF